MKFSFEQRLGLLFLFTFAGIVAIGIVAVKNKNSFNDTNYWVRHTEDVLRESDQVLNLAKDIGGERAYLTTRDTDFFTQFNISSQTIFDHIALLKTLTSDNLAQQNRIDSITKYTRLRVAHVLECKQLIDNGQISQAAALIDSKRSKYWMDDIRKTIADLENEETFLLDQRKADNGKSIAAFNGIIALLLVTLVVLIIASYLAIRYNLSKRIVLENELRQTNHFISAILENIPNMIFVKDGRDLRFVRFNKAGEELLGKTRAELLGKNDYDFFPKEQADFFTSKDRDVLNLGTLTNIDEEPIQTKDGLRWLHTKKIPITDETGEIKYLLGISEDITERKRNLDEIKQLNIELHNTIEQLLQANREMEAFTYSVSHDLRAPLRIIDGFGEILLKDHGEKLNAEGLRDVEVIMKNARHMGQLIDDLLNLSRLGRTQLTVKNVDMGELVEDVITALKVVDHGITAQINIAPLNSVNCDMSLLRQVWINLISNAIKYSSKKKNAVIDIGCETLNGNVVYFIKDNGAGFDMQYAGKLFGVFQRLHKISEFEGTGVGLALVQRIIFKHNGKIWAEAKVDEGASFYFTLNSSLS